MLRLFIIPLTAFAAAIAMLPLSNAMAIDQNDRVAEPHLSTIAGSGFRGRLDGTANLASFLTPSGVAMTSDETLYVSDVAAQTIRRIEGGRVDTFAGATTPGNSPEIRVGGFQDKPVAQARFNRPIAVAAHKNALYVVDAGNHRIREIANGVVSTLVGDGKAAATDGRGTQGSLA